MFLQSIQRADSRLFETLTDRKCAKLMAQISRFISRTGDGHLYAIFGAAAAIWGGEHGMLFLISGLIAFAFDLPTYYAVKNGFKRHRPYVVLRSLPAFIKPSDQFSLPSGHSAGAFLMATLIGQFYPDYFGFCVVWAAFIGVSRILLRVHFPSDVLCGAVLGMSAAHIGMLLADVVV